MVDCGATTNFIGERFVRESRICMHPLNHEIPLYNINGLKNCAGKITCFACLQLTISNTEEPRDFLMMDLGPENVVLGLP